MVLLSPEQLRLTEKLPGFGRAALSQSSKVCFDDGLPVDGKTIVLGRREIPMTKHGGDNDSASRPSWDALTTWNGKMAAALGQAGAAYTKACLEWQQEVARFVGARLDQDRLAQESLTNCRDLGDLAKAQQDWATKATKDYLDEAARLTELASQFARAAMAPVYEGGQPAPGGRKESKAAE